jgi:ABC-type antimicrobial peptide transport system permease subunit
MPIGQVYDSSDRFWADILVDQQWEAFVDQENDTLAHYYIMGDVASAERDLAVLQAQYPQLKWGSLKEELDRSEGEINQRYGFFIITVWGLIVIMSIGWLNSLINMLRERKREYNMLHILGIPPIRIAKIIVYQVYSYLFAGILLGSGFGFLLMLILGLALPSLKSLLLIVLYLLIVSLFLMPFVKRIAYDKNLLHAIDIGE